jgi:hypothetical protein
VWLPDSVAYTYVHTYIHTYIQKVSEVWLPDNVQEIQGAGHLIQKYKATATGHQDMAFIYS